MLDGSRGPQEALVASAEAGMGTHGMDTLHVEAQETQGLQVKAAGPKKKLAQRCVTGTGQPGLTVEERGQIPSKEKTLSLKTLSLKPCGNQKQGRHS